MGDWTIKNSYYLTLMTLAYIIGEIAHFLINTTGREVARDVHFGDKSCYFNESVRNQSQKNSYNCTKIKDQKSCSKVEFCSWEYSGLGIEYQVLAGPAFVAVFSVSGVLISILSDKLKSSVSRVVLVGIGTAVFSSACLLMGLANSYWQLVLLRMMIAAGESVCRPMCGAMLADIFSARSRGVANGIFSWGVYVGFGMAFVLGINGTKADIAGYGWRAPYIIAAVPGLVIAALFLTTLKDPKPEVATPSPMRSTSHNTETKSYLQKLLKCFTNPALLLLLLAAMARHTAGFTWAYNTRLFFQNYHPEFDLGYWILLASVLGGSFGVFAGGFFSDRLVGKLGLHSRLWLLSLCTILAAPLAAGVLYFPPPGAMGFLIAYYFFAETWFAVLFTVIVEIVDVEVRATCIALFLFCMNQVGGNLPVVIAPLKDYLSDYRSALTIVWPGFLALSSVLFFLSSFPLCYMERERQRRAELDEQRQVSPERRSTSPGSNTESQESEDKAPVDAPPTVPLLIK